jgi:hypothetical protein
MGQQFPKSPSKVSFGTCHAAPVFVARKGRWLVSAVERITSITGRGVR